MVSTGVYYCLIVIYHACLYSVVFYWCARVVPYSPRINCKIIKAPEESGAFLFPVGKQAFLPVFSSMFHHSCTIVF